MRLVAACALGLLVGCVRDPRDTLARAPRVAAGRDAVRLVKDPCSRRGILLAPVAIGPVQTWLVVDSGAYAHALLPSIVKQAGLVVRPETVLVGDGAGVRAGLTSASLRFPGLGESAAEGVLVIELSHLARCGQGGVVSPARLRGRDAAVVLDVASARLAVMSPPRARSLLDAHRGVTLPTVFDGYGHNVAASVGGAAATLLIDTGACCTWVYRDSPAGQALLPHARPIVDGATDIQGVRATHRVTDVEIRAGDMRWVTTVELMPGTGGFADGALGIGELATCVLAWHAPELEMRCTPPRE